MSPSPSAIGGVTIGIVTNNEDPEGLGRVKVRLPFFGEEIESDWARVATLMAGPGRGTYFLPEVEDEVLVAFLHGDVHSPYVLGALWNGVDAPPEQNDDGENNRRVIKTRSGHVIRFDDSEGSERIEIVDKSEENRIVLDSGENTVTIASGGDIVIKAGGKLVLEGSGVEITSEADIKIESQTATDIKAAAAMTIQGQTVDIN